MSTKTIIKKTFNVGLIAALVVMGYVSIFHSDWVVAGIPKVSAQSISSDKADPECTGHETAGRCADKCPNETDTLLGYDQETGAAVCKSAPTGCPYGDSIPMDECDKFAPQPAVYNDYQAAPTADLSGK
jgi:hypothetical protein